MDMTFGSGRAGARLAAFLLALGTALLIVFAGATPAWAEKGATSADPLTDLAAIGAIFGDDDVQDNVIEVTAASPVGGPSSGVGICMKFDQPVELRLQSTFTLTEKSLVFMGAKVTITGEGKITGTAQGTYSLVQVGSATPGSLTLAGGTVSSSSEGSTINVANGSADFTGGTAESTRTSALYVSAGGDKTSTATITGDATLKGGGADEHGYAVPAVCVGSGKGPGTLTVSGGQIIATGGKGSTPAQGLFVAGNATLTITGGTITAKGGNGVSLSSQFADGNRNTVTMSGGKIVAAYGIVAQGKPAAGTVNPTIALTGGTIEAARHAVEVQASVQSNGDAATVSIAAAEDGTAPQLTGDVYNESAAKVSIAAGTVTGDVKNKGADTVEVTACSIEGNVTNTGAGEVVVASGTVTGNVANTGTGPVIVGTLDEQGQPATGPTIIGQLTSTNADTTTFNAGTVTEGFGEDPKVDVAKPGRVLKATYDDGRGGTVTAYGTSPFNLGVVASGTSFKLEAYDAGNPYRGPRPRVQLPDSASLTNDTDALVQLESASGETGLVAPGSTAETPSDEFVPGDYYTILRQVAGMVKPAHDAMAAYAEVGTSDDLLTWTIEVNGEGGATPLAQVADDLIVPLLGAVQLGGSPSATSAQLPSLTLALKDSSVEEHRAFALQVLENVAPMEDDVEGPRTTALDADATLADLVGKTCGIVCQTNSGTLTFTFNFVGAAELPAEVEAVYRLYNPFDYLHLYTTDLNEKAELMKLGWTVDFDGAPCWYAPAPGSAQADHEVVRLYNPFNGDHYFVKATDGVQLDELLALGWQRDGGASSLWSAAPSEPNVEVSTLFNPFATRDTHLWTADPLEVEARTAEGWQLHAPTLWALSTP